MRRKIEKYAWQSNEKQYNRERKVWSCASETKNIKFKKRCSIELNNIVQKLNDGTVFSIDLSIQLICQ